MNILQLCDNNNEITDLSQVLEYFGHKIVNKYKFDNISLISYDAFIITVDILEKYEENKDFFQKIENLKRPIIYVYHSNNKTDDYGMKLLSNKYKLKFKLSDASILDTPNWNYKPGDYSGNEEAYSMTSSNGEGNCYVKNTKQFFIFKKNNIIVLHDLYIHFYGQNQLDTSRMSNMIKYILQTDVEESNDIVDWLNNINILEDEKLNLMLKENQDKIEKLLIEQNSIKEELKQNEFYKAILYSSGNKLVEIVKVILEEMLKLAVDDTDLKKQDLYFIIDNKNILIEVKGVNHPFQRDNISQVKRHVKDYAEEHNIYGSDVDKLCKGVLILNPYSLHDLKDKISKDFYSKEVIEDAEYEKVCTLDTLTLLNYYSKWRNDSKSINLKKILLNNNYNEPDYNEIINL